MNELRDKVCVITGATSGVGWALALALAKQGGRLFLIGRNQTRAARLLKAIRKIDHDSQPVFLPCDLADQQQIRATAAAIRAATPCVHLLINNAHVRLGKVQANTDGTELTFAVNHLAYFTLTALLLEPLLAAPEARIINVSGDAYLWGSSDWERSINPATVEQRRALATSKLANVIFTIELARRLRGTAVTVNSMHPGIVATRAGTNGQLWRMLKYYIYYGSKGEMISAGRAAIPLTELCILPKWSRTTGCYFSNGQPQEVPAVARNAEATSRLWDISLRLTGLDSELGQAWQYFAPNPECSYLKIPTRATEPGI